MDNITDIQGILRLRRQQNSTTKFVDAVKNRYPEGWKQFQPNQLKALYDQWLATGRL